jgi:hypothetical protein
MDGRTVLKEGKPDVPSAAAWSFVEVDDFDFDDRDDILVRKDNGNWRVYLISGLQVKDESKLQMKSDTTWQPIVD